MTERENSEGALIRPKRSRKPLLAMLIISVLPVCGAYLAFFTGIGVPTRTVNKGIFITPAESIETLVGDLVWENIQRDKKWRLLLPLPSDCNQACEKNFYTTRQVHIRLDQKSGRLQRIAIALEAPTNTRDVEELSLKNPRLQIVENNSEYARAWFKKIQEKLKIEQEYYVLVDQEGFAMMAYTTEQHGNDLLKDIKRALKASIDYQ